MTNGPAKAKAQYSNIIISHIQHSKPQAALKHSHNTGINTQIFKFSVFKNIQWDSTVHLHLKMYFFPLQIKL